MALLLANDQVEWVSVMPSGVKKDFEWRISADQYLELYMLKTTRICYARLPEPYTGHEAAAQYFMRAVPHTSETRTREFLHGLFEKDKDYREYLLNCVREEGAGLNISHSHDVQTDISRTKIP
jgi:hypothetical protein